MPGNKTWMFQRAESGHELKAKKQRGNDAEGGERGCDQRRVPMASLYPPAAEGPRQHVAVGAQYQGLHASFETHAQTQYGYAFFIGLLTTLEENQSPSSAISNFMWFS